MSEKANVVVVFSQHGARILTNPDLTHFDGHTNVLLNPEFPPGVPPHRWFKDGDKIGVFPKGVLGYITPNNGHSIIRMIHVKQTALIALGVTLFTLTAGVAICYALMRYGLLHFPLK